MSTKRTWLVGVGNTEADGVVISRVYGTDYQVKRHLMKLIRKNRENDPENWDNGTERIRELDVSGDGGRIEGYATYYDYHIDYTAVAESAAHVSFASESSAAEEKPDAKNWIVGIANAAGNGVYLMRVSGTVDEIKGYMMTLIEEDREMDISEYEYGTDLEEELDVADDGNRIDGCLVFSRYHIDYTAVAEEEPVILSKKEETI